MVSLSIVGTGCASSRSAWSRSTAVALKRMDENEPKMLCRAGNNRYVANAYTPSVGSTALRFCSRTNKYNTITRRPPKANVSNA